MPQHDVASYLVLHIRQPLFSAQIQGFHFGAAPVLCIAMSVQYPARPGSCTRMEVRVVCMSLFFAPVPEQSDGSREM